MKEELESIAELSRYYGGNELYVFLGGGNSSVKDEDYLYIKPSGKALATIQGQDFIKVERQALARLFSMERPLVSENATEEQRKALDGMFENVVESLIGSAVRSDTKLHPSVETPLHDVFAWKYVMHLHPTLINGMTCAQNGKSACTELFPEALWFDYCNPGHALSVFVKNKLDEYAKANGGALPHILFLGNHGVFVGAETTDEIKAIYADIIAKLTARYEAAGITPVADEIAPIDSAAVLENAPRLRTLLAKDGESRASVVAVGKCAVYGGPITPDHIVYANSFGCKGECTSTAIQTYVAQFGRLPKLVEIQGAGTFAAGDSVKEANAAATALRNGLFIEKLAKAFGGIKYIDAAGTSFIENWNAEVYRRGVSLGAMKSARLNNRICVVTGGAQGFGLGIAEVLCANGGQIVIADMNFEGAQKAADGLNAKFGNGRACAVAVNISDEDSVAAMAAEITAKCGGIDLLVANAGVVRAGSVMEISKKDWDFVTNINYTGYFLCCKYVARVMAKQIVDGKGLWSDIVQVNSKSGLEGSNKNGAYAGSKFGTIGLTQSFAKELVEQCIKVNSVCPGNYYDGPLWSHPEKGLFIQYLQNGKVPGAKTVEDVRRFYEDKVPMRRGCLPPDVARAIMYCVEQQYETGQAIPVTGGQVMLN